MEWPRDVSGSRIRPFSRAEYWRMIEAGIIGADERVELLEGEIVEMSPQGSHHSTVIQLVAKALERAFGDGHSVRQQLPLVLADDSEPEPDVAVVLGSPDDYLKEQPKTALVVVEVADTTLAKDRWKARIYSEAAIADYWIANLVEGVLEVHRAPRRLPSGEWGYADVARLETSAKVTPLALPKVSIALSDFMR